MSENHNNLLNEAANYLRNEHNKFKQKAEKKYNNKRNVKFVKEVSIEMAIAMVHNKAKIKDANILDFGCGRAKIKNLLRGHNVYVGIDISKTMIDALESKKKDNEAFLKASITEFDLPNMAHISFCIDVLRYIDKKYVPKAIQKMSSNAHRCMITIGKEYNDVEETIETIDWWKKEISAFFNIIEQRETTDQAYFLCYTKGVQDE